MKQLRSQFRSCFFICTRLHESNQP